MTTAARVHRLPGSEAPVPTDAASEVRARGTTAGCQLPPPPVPVEVDLSGFSKFMFDVDRFLGSELVALATPEEGWAALRLWARAWKQTPPASLPSDDRILASFSGTGKRWPKVRAMAMRGFVLCADGRYYHGVLAEEALAAWKRRRTRDQDADRLRRWRERDRNASAATIETSDETRNETPDETPDETPSVAVDRTGQDTDRTTTPPVSPPKGGEASPGLQRKAAAKRRSRKSEGDTFDEWVARCAASGEDRIPGTDPIREYAETVGLPDEFLRLAWLKFRERYRERQPGARYLDWRAHFRNAVHENWFRLWYAKDDGSVGLTTAGETLRRWAASQRPELREATNAG